jgi:hypothetical protein
MHWCFFQLDHVSAHRATCPAPNFSQSSNYARSLDPSLYHTSSPQSQECAYYSPMYTGPPTLSPGAGSFYRTQPAVFSPFYSTNSLGYDSYGQESWLSRQSRDSERSSCKENRSTKVPLPASSSCLYSQNYSAELYADSALDSCFLSRSSQQQASTSRGNLRCVLQILYYLMEFWLLSISLFYVMHSSVSLGTFLLTKKKKWNFLFLILKLRIFCSIVELLTNCSLKCVLT